MRRAHVEDCNKGSLGMHTVALARHAMATRFELLLHGNNPVSLRAAGEEALDEIDRLESQLSLYRPESELSHVNRHAAEAPVRVSPGLFYLLQHAQQLSLETQGAFDLTVAPLVRCWGFLGGHGHPPTADALQEARDHVGMHWVELDEARFTVRFARPGMMLDLGAIGKGYAVERAAELLREAGVTCALIHGGTSTIQAIGTQPSGGPWQVLLEQPPNSPGPASSLPPTLAHIPLQDEALSVSAIWGKSFQLEGKTMGHILDPRTGSPTANAVLAAVALPSATESDALSTALLIAGIDGHDALASLRPGIRTLVVAPTHAPGPPRCKSCGIMAATTGC